MDAKVNPKKIEMFQTFNKFLENKENIFFLDYRGLTVLQLTKLRNKIESEQGALKVVKNNIMKRVLEQKKIIGLDSCLVGPTAVVTALEEANVIAKIFYEFVENSSLRVKGGFVLGEIYDELQVNEYSKLPTKNEAIALFLGVLQAPVAKFARTLQALADSRN